MVSGLSGRKMGGSLNFKIEKMLTKVGIFYVKIIYRKN